jgi:GAF domain-containing protein
MLDRERLTVRAFVRLADTLADEFDIVEFLQGLSADAVELLGAETAGVMLADGRGGLRLVASSEERMRVLELFEIQHDQGPCPDAYMTGLTVQASAEEGRRRWPTFAPAAARDGFSRMCAVPLQLRGNTIGALNLFRANDDPFTTDELEVAQAMASVAAIGLLQRRAIDEHSLLAEQLQSALQSRVVIEQAKGMIAQSLSVSVDDAFKALRKWARANNLELTELARRVTTRPNGADVLRDAATGAT